MIADEHAAREAEQRGDEAGEKHPAGAAGEVRLSAGIPVLILIGD